MSWRTEAHDAVVVTCSGPDWRIFVPVVRATAVAAPAPMRTAAASPVKLEPVVRRGDPVVIEAGSNGFSISREGVAMADAAPGARFAVRVADAKAPVQAVAVASGRATLPGWGE
jgi:flagella basal body P-ring formation protein FlgA